MIQKLLLLFTLFTFSGNCIETAHTLYLKAYQLFSEHQFKKAETVLVKSIKMDSDFSEPYFLLSKVYFRLQSHNQAINYFKKGQKIKRKIKEHLKFSQSSSLDEVKSGIDSVAFLSIRKIKEAKKAYFEGKLARKKGKWYLAIEQFERAVDLDSGSITYLNALGDAFLDVNSHYAAEEIFSNSLDKNIFQRSIYQKLIQINETLSRPARAMHWVLKGKKAFPSDKWFKDRQLYYDYRVRLKLKNE
ncbi:MAG: hypothetical protein COB02_04815 [Candidatus Cloacimonadota bacterium]|nr:MAG: hypothetical protein COB02_04815 [Candidatus Cloacimonadota bacterium]